MKKIFLIIITILCAYNCYGMQHTKVRSAGLSDDVTEAQLQRVTRLNVMVDWIKQQDNTSPFWDAFANILLLSKQWHDAQQKLEQVRTPFEKEFEIYQESKPSLDDRESYRSKFRQQQIDILNREQLVNNLKNSHDTQLNMLLGQFPLPENSGLSPRSITIEDTYIVATARNT